MAAFVGGTTAHGWGRVPVNTNLVQEGARSKKASSEVDELFLRAQSIRWLIIDEISTLGAWVTGVFDSNLRRARMRQPYAKREDGSARPFGGLNVRLCGDFFAIASGKSNWILQ